MKLKRKKTKSIIKLKRKSKQVKRSIYKLEAKPLSEEQIAYFVNFHKENGYFPGQKIPCSVSGKLTTCIGPWMQKKIKEFGGVENLLRNYKCRGVIKLNKQIIKPVKSKKKTKVSVKEELKNWDIPKINFAPPKPLTFADLQITTESQCLRPDIYLTNGRHCDGCEYFNACRNRLKCLPKYIKK